MTSINIQNVSKKYRVGNKTKYVLKDFTTFINSDKCNFLIGYNGSGKSTLIKCVLNHVDYEGKIDVNSNKISYAPEKIVLPDYSTVYNFLKNIAEYKDIPNHLIDSCIEEYIIKFDLSEHKNKAIMKLSKGNRQKVNLVQALLGESDIYIFDEPLSGLDDATKEVFIDEIKRLRKNSKLIVISTHYLKDYRFRIRNVIQMGELNE